LRVEERAASGGWHDFKPHVTGHIGPNRARARTQRRKIEDEDRVNPDKSGHAAGEQEEFLMRTFANWEEVPIFDSEEAEAEFWVENRPDLRLMEAATAGNAEAAESVTITLRIDPRMLARIKRLARSRYLNYQSMIKQWLSERMEDELREK
jgi:predicted DNA binding CopG/RHH family protein